MGANDRIVQHLRLRAPSQQAATRALYRLEDALRCASLPDAGERLLLVRRLDLGKLPAGLSSQSLSLLIEQRVLRAGCSWVHGDAPSSGRAGAVYFNSCLEAAQSATLRRAGEHTLAEWFWPLALPGVVLQGSDGMFLEGMVACLGDEVHAAASLPALLTQLVQRGETGWLVQHLSPEAVEYVVARSGARRFMEVVAPGHASESMRSVDAIHFQDPAGATIRLPADLSRDWLRAVLRAANWREVKRSSSGPLSKSGRTSEPLPVPACTGPMASGRADLSASAPGNSLPKMPPVLPAAGAGDAPQRPSLMPAERGRRNSPAPVQAAAEGASDSHVQDPFEAARPTVAGGVLFLLPVLERLGLPAWQAAHDDAPLGGFVLRAALERLQVRDDDPVWAMVQSLPGPDPLLARRWDVAPAWLFDEIAVDHAPQHLMTPAQVAGLWLLACRRYLRRVARIGLASVCLRPALLRWSVTHLDVCFALDASDVRVRRAALDVDPGWQAWLGRVVHFRYVDGGAQ